MAVDIRKHLAKLRDAIRKVEMDAEMRASARRLDSDISDFLDARGDDAAKDSLLKRAAQLEAKFSKRYPTIARVASELLEAIAKGG